MHIHGPRSKRQVNEHQLYKQTRKRKDKSQTVQTDKKDREKEVKEEIHSVVIHDNNRNTK